MPENRQERTDYLGLLALMCAVPDQGPGPETDDWSYPYWNILQIDAALNALAQAVRDGTVPLLAPSGAPAAALSSSPGSLAAGMSLEIGQTFVDEYGRETNVGPLATVSTGDALASPVDPLTVGAPTLGGMSGYEGGLLEVWFSWTDGAGGETLPSPVAQVDVPYQAGGLLSEVDVTLPSTPAAVGAAGANIYLRHRGGNIVLAYRVLTAGSAGPFTLTGAVADCYRSLPQANTTGSNKAIDITGEAAPGGAALTRFYIRLAGASWPAGDRRLKLAGVDEWDPDTVTYPLVYTGATAELTAGFPPTVSQVKAIRPLDLGTEVIGTLDVSNLPSAVTLETELVRSVGECLISGLAVTAHGPADMGVHVATGEALIAAGRFLPAACDRTIPTADVTNPRIDLICLADDGTVEGPTENAALKGSPSGAPSAPATPAGYICLAQVRVEAGATSIISAKITDERVLLTTLVAETIARIAGDATLAGELTTHEGDTDAHRSHPGSLDETDTTCSGSSTSDFTITCPADMLVTEVKSVVTSGGVVDYMLELFSDSGRTILQYQAGEVGAGNGIQVASFDDRLPWEWYSGNGTTIYGRITNNSADDLTAIALNVKYRR